MWSSTEPWTAGSGPWTTAAARCCGSSKQRPASSAIPITFLVPDHKQYVAIYSGVGGWMGAVAQPTISLDRSVCGARGCPGAMKNLKKMTAPGDMLYVFSL